VRAAKAGRREYGVKLFGASRLISSEGPPERLLELLTAGETVAIAFDVGGSSTVPFPGRSITLSGGIGTIAVKTEAVVLPVVPERHGSRVDVRLLPPIDARDHPDAQAVRVAIARTFEPVVLERPEAVELAWYPSPLVTEAPPSVWHGAMSGLPMA
jgi:lauroyl/myristoyl acyltransferase